MDEKLCETTETERYAFYLKTRKLSENLIYIIVATQTTCDWIFRMKKFEISSQSFRHLTSQKGIPKWVLRIVFMEIIISMNNQRPIFDFNGFYQNPDEEIMNRKRKKMHAANFFGEENNAKYKTNCEKSKNSFQRIFSWFFRIQVVERFRLKGTYIFFVRFRLFANVCIVVHTE